MSSSRSIAAARQKRAGEQNNNTSQGKPVTSISSQAVFAQQQQQIRNPQQQVGKLPSQVKPRSAPQMQSQPVSQAQQQKQLNKISISDAIGLITLRLGKLEKFIQESLEDGGSPFSSNNYNYENNDNMKLVSDEVFENIINRLNKLESSFNSINLNESFNKVNKDIKDIKDSFNSLNVKINNFIKETHDKFVDYEAAIVEIEKTIDNSQIELEMDNQDNDVTDDNENIDMTTESIVSELPNNFVNGDDFIVDNETNENENIEE